MKRIVLVLAALLSLTATASAAETRLEVRTPTGPAAAGETFQVEAHITGNEGFRSCQFVLTYDADRLECTKVNAGTLIRDALWAGNPASPDGAAFAAAAAEAVQGDGQAAVFTFRAKEDLSEIDIRPEKIYVFGTGNLDGIQLPVSAAIIPVPRSEAQIPASGQTAQPETTPPASGQTAQPETTPPASGQTAQPETTPPASGQTAQPETTPPASGQTAQPETTPPASGQTAQLETTPPASETLPSSDTAAASSETLPSSDTAAASSETLPSSETASPASGQNGGQSGGAEQNRVPADSAPPASGPSPFTDTAGLWAEQDILEASRRGLFHGYPDGTFRPNNVITRGQYVLVLWNLAGRPAPEKTPPFQDLDSLSDEFRDAVTWAWENGYVNGTAPDRFSSGGYLTRQAAMKILFGFNGGESGAELLFTDAYDSVYQDSGKLSAWAREGVYWAVYHSILRGVTSTTLNPAGVLTRAQLAAIMIRYTDKFPAA